MKKQHGRSSGALAPVVTGEMTRTKDAQPPVTNQMRTDDASLPISRDAIWRSSGTTRRKTIDATVSVNDLQDPDELTVWLYVKGARGEHTALMDGTRMTRDVLRETSRVLAALVERIDREHDGARRELRDWRRAYTSAMADLGIRE